MASDQRCTACKSPLAEDCGDCAVCAAYGPPKAKPFRLSASKLKRFLQCPRSYFLKYVQHVPEEFGGRYLEVGNAYDLHVQWYLSRGAKGVRSIDPKLLRMFDAAKRHLPEPGSVEVQLEYRVDAGGFFVEGKPDLRRPCRVGDTKTTADRGRGVGREPGKPPIALNERTLLLEPQPLLYSWCEFQRDLEARTCVLEWVYVSKETKPTAWTVRAEARREYVEAWFDEVVRPAAAAMAKLHDEVDADRVRAELDACDSPKCWVRAACDPYSGPNNYDGTVDSLISPASLKRTRPVSPAKQSEGVVDMAFDLKRLAEESVDLETPLRASLDQATGGLTLARKWVDDSDPRAAMAEVMAGDEIPINPPPAVDYAAELAEAIAQCQSAAARAAGLLARLRGGS